MKKRSQTTNFRSQPASAPPIGGLSVRTNLRAGLAWDDLDDQAALLWGKLTSAVSDASSALTGGSDTSTPAA